MENATPALDRRSRQLGEAGRKLICAFEACQRARRDGTFEAYPDPGSGAAPWTIGWGSTGPDIHAGLIWTQAQCDARLAAQLARFVADVANAIRDAPTTANQFDAMVAFQYNTGAIARARLTGLHIRGDYAGAKAAFADWTRAKGVVMPGLVRRRAAEAALYATPEPAQ
jgi:GH24 family phage-related lysozyme (muramidase)